MSESYDSQKMPSGDFRKLLQEGLDNPKRRRVELTAEEKTCKIVSYRLGLLKLSTLPLHGVLAVVNFTTTEMLSC